MIANRSWIRELSCLLLLVGILLAGCASQKMPDLKSQIGIITYDEVLIELGPPNHVATLDNGGRVAQWLQYTSRVYSTPGLAYGGWGPWGPGFGTPAVSSTPAVYLLLTFGPDSKLQSVRHQYK